MLIKIKSTLKKLLAASLLLSSPLLMASESYQGRGAFAVPTQTSNSEPVSISVISDFRGKLPIYRHKGTNWTPGEINHRYSIMVKNNTSARVLVVVSVDGLNVINGKTASYDQQGYVLEPFSYSKISGWRKSMNSVARFYFTDNGSSYASLTGRPGNVGVIGAAVFREKQVVHGYSDMAPASASMEKSQAGRSVGTGHGEKEYSSARYTDFVKARNYPDSVIAIRYETPSNLRKLGVIKDSYDGVRDPSPFPKNEFTPDP